MLPASSARGGAGRAKRGRPPAAASMTASGAALGPVEALLERRLNAVTGAVEYLAAPASGTPRWVPADRVAAHPLAVPAALELDDAAVSGFRPHRLVRALPAAAAPAALLQPVGATAPSPPPPLDSPMLPPRSAGRRAAPGSRAALSAAADQPGGMAAVLQAEAAAAAAFSVPLAGAGTASGAAEMMSPPSGASDDSLLSALPPEDRCGPLAPTAVRVVALRPAVAAAAGDAVRLRRRLLPCDVPGLPLGVREVIVGPGSGGRGPQDVPRAEVERWAAGLRAAGAVPRTPVDCAAAAMLHLLDATTAALLPAVAARASAAEAALWGGRGESAAVDPPPAGRGAGGAAPGTGLSAAELAVQLPRGRAGAALEVVFDAGGARHSAPLSEFRERHPVALTDFLLRHSRLIPLPPTA